MSRFFLLGACIGLLLVPGARAQNPDDVEFRAEFAKKSAAFHAGEPIAVEISYASSAEKKYFANWMSPSPFFGSVEVAVTPREDVTDLRELVRGWAGSIAGSEDYLGQKPRVQQLELNQWFRFGKPGHFVLTLKSKGVSRQKTQEEGGGMERLTLEAEPLAFDILPEDAAWEAGEFGEIERILEEAPPHAAERSAAMHRLALLDSPAAVRKLAEFYFAEPNGDFSGDAYRGLNNSGQGDLVITLLKEGMSDPAKNQHAIGADLLAELEARKEKGLIPPRPKDPEEQKEWQKKLAERDKTYNEFFAQANALIVASLKQRTGKERAEATYEAWSNAQRLNAGKTGTPAAEALQNEVLETVADLAPGEQLNFVTSGWGTVPHEQLRPTIERLITSGGERAPYLRDQGYELLCRDWPKDCAVAILAAAQRPDAQISRNTILLLAEEEHPELDAMLEAKLHESKMPPDSFENQRMSTLVMRAGSRKLVKKVQEFLDQPAAPRTYGCQTQAALIGYLFRFAPQDAAKRILAVTLDEKDDCARGVLQMLSRERYSDELLPVAEKTLDSENLSGAAPAGLFLARHGTSADEEKLRNRLQKLWKDWSERGAEVRSSQGPGVRMPGGNVAAQQAANLEQALVSALVAGTSWKLTDAQKEELRAGCLTENCRAMAEGKMSVGF